MKRTFALVTATALSLSLLLTSCGGGTATNPSSAPAGDGGNSSGSASVTLRLGHVVADDSSLDKGLDKFAELVAEKSNGTIEVQVYANSTLGDNTSMAEQLQFGSLDMMAPSVAALSGFTSATALFDMPYLFKNEAAAEEVLDGEIGDEIGSYLEEPGFHMLSWMTQSWRHVTCNKEVHQPSDMAGIKIRTMDSEYHIAHFNALGASAIPMNMADVYTGLQQGTIDAQENPYTNIVTSRFYEVQDYVVETAHIYDACPLIISNITWNKLTDDQKAILQEAADEATTWERAEVLADDEANRQLVEESGTTVIELTEDERNAFREAAQSVYDSYIEAQGQQAADWVAAIDEINAKH